MKLAKPNEKFGKDQPTIILTKEQWKGFTNKLMGRSANYKDWQTFYAEGNYAKVEEMWREFANENGSTLWNEVIFLIDRARGERLSIAQEIEDTLRKYEANDAEYLLVGRSYYWKLAGEFRNLAKVLRAGSGGAVTPPSNEKR